MAKNNKTIFQKLTDVIIGTTGSNLQTKSIANYTLNANNDVLYTFGSKEERDAKLRQIKQEKLLAHQWAKIGYDTSMEQMAGANQVRVMYRDCDMMDAWPEIGSALDTYAEEVCNIGKKGTILNIKSKSPRIVSILEDLFVNRLDIAVMLPMVTRATCKYGNEFMFLNIDAENGILGWRELPTKEIRRVEDGMMNAYSGNYSASATNLKTNEVKFVWEGHDESVPFKNWQIAHFRLIKDSIYLPYGASVMNKARRHWRILSMMEDSMLLYRLEKSVERRIYKVNVGLIDDQDVPAFLQEFMNNVKRAPIIDPQTGQIDLRKNFLDVSADYVIPVRSGQDPTSIEVLQSNQNQLQMSDIEYMQNKVLAGMRVPKAMLNYSDAQNKAQNFSLIDIRFNRVVNSIQQAIIMELNKIAIIHLYILGFTDELTNFTLTMNNPSNQIEMLELDNMSKRISNATAALAEQGGGIPLMSWHKVQKEIMGLTDSEISDMLNEMRLEVAIAKELENTPQIIKKTDLFKQVDRIYGEPGAHYQETQTEDDGGQFGGGGGGMPSLGGGGFGDDLGDLGEPGAEPEGDIGGEEGSADLQSMGGDESGGGQPLNERSQRFLTLLNEYSALINKDDSDKKNIDIYDKGFLINESLDSAIKSLGNGEIKEILK